MACKSTKFHIQVFMALSPYIFYKGGILINGFKRKLASRKLIDIGETR